MYALVEIKGRQFKAQKGALLKIDRISQEKGEAADFEQVLLLRDEKKVLVGTPYVEGATVKTTVEDHGRDDKITVIKFKKRKNYRKKQGHRQQFTLIRVDEIVSA